MKKNIYQQPVTEVVLVNTQAQLLSASEPTGTTLYETGFDSNSEALSRGHHNIWDEDDEK